jgi:hypothetical protein
VTGELEASKPIVGLFVRTPMQDVVILRDAPELLATFDAAVPMAEGRAFDLGRAWEPLAVLLDGGVCLPEHGPTLGEVPLPDSDPRAAWSYVDPARVVTVAAELDAHCRHFAKLYTVDGEDTDPFMSDARTGGYRGNRDYLIKKLGLLATHYADAASLGQAMLVRIGERL